MPMKLMKQNKGRELRVRGGRHERHEHMKSHEQHTHADRQAGRHARTHIAAGHTHTHTHTHTAAGSSPHRRLQRNFEQFTFQFQAALRLCTKSALLLLFVWCRANRTTARRMKL